MVLDGMQPARIRTMDAVEGEVSAQANRCSCLGEMACDFRHDFPGDPFPASNHPTEDAKVSI